MMSDALVSAPLPESTSPSTPAPTNPPTGEELKPCSPDGTQLNSLDSLLCGWRASLGDKARPQRVSMKRAGNDRMPRASPAPYIRIRGEESLGVGGILPVSVRIGAGRMRDGSGRMRTGSGVGQKRKRIPLADITGNAQWTTPLPDNNDSGARTRPATPPPPPPNNTAPSTDPRPDDIYQDETSTPPPSEQLLAANTALYNLLELTDTTSTTDQIRSAYKTVALKYHPDKVAEEEREVANAKMQEINAARDVLLDPARRAVYDGTGVVVAEMMQTGD